jgi:hypothetical protein
MDVFNLGVYFMKYMIMIAMMFVSTYSFGGECVNGTCALRSRVVNVTRDIISVPVQVTKRTVEATRNVGRRTVARVRSVVR